MLNIILALLLASLIWYYASVRLPKSFPPGPRWAVPLLGHSLSLGGNFISGLQSLKKRYGDISGLYLGSRKTVVLYTYNLTLEAFSKDEFTGRRGGDTSKLMRGGSSINGEPPGVLAADGQTWREQRRFSLSTLKDFGYGKVNMEKMIEDEVYDLLQHWETDLVGKSISCQALFNISVLNSLWRILTGERLARNDTKAKELISLVNEANVELAKPLNNVIFSYYWLTRLLKSLGQIGLISTFNKVAAFIQPTIEEHKRTYQADSMRDFLDAYLKEQSKAREGSSFHSLHGEHNLHNLFIDFFLAGSETTSTTLTWALLFMVNNPDVQSQVQEELDNACGRDRLPDYADREMTPLVEAVIHEVQRRANIVALGAPHRAIQDTRLGSYAIPADTIVFSALGEVMHNPEDFPDPYKFNPRRYISEDGKFRPHPKVIPFGLGKRRCLGETLAKMSLYKFITGLMQRFKVERVSEEPLDETPLFSIAQSPKPFEIRLKYREE